MKQSHILFITAILALAASCSITEPEGAEAGPVALQKEITITATSGEPDTRTERAADGSVLWSPGDQISLFYGSGADGGSCFTAQNTETAKTVNFTGTIGVITGGNNIAVEDTYFWAVYPYNATASCDGNSITTVLPAEQVATADTFADDLFPSMGRSQGLNMSFYNICGGIKFTVSEEGIKSVTLKANSGEQIVGTITAAFDGGVPVVTNIANGSDTITLTAPAGETFEVGKAYFFVMVPTVFESGFTLTFSKGYARAERVINSKATIKRSVFGTMNTPDAGQEWEMLYVPIPDENFRAYMIQNFDTNGNGVLDFDEAEAVTAINVRKNNIVSLSGVEYCASLTTLDCRSNQLTSLDVSLNTALVLLDCHSNQLTSLDVSLNTALKSLYCGNNQLTSLDVSANTALTRLYCYSNKLSSLDVSANTELKYLNCSWNQLTSLDVSANIALTSLDCLSNQLTSLNVSANAALTNLDCRSNQLTSLDVRSNTALTYLACDNNQLTSLDVSKNTTLTYLQCVDNQLTSLDVRSNTALQSLYCGNNQLASLDVSTNTALQNLYCNDNQLTNFDVSNNTALTSLICDYNQLTSLDVSHNVDLVSLCCSSNQLTSLDVSSNTALTQLVCSSNQLTSLDVSSNTVLFNRRCFGNQLTSLNVSKNTALTDLYCSPMNDSAGQNLLGYLYISQGQSIPNVTENRSAGYIPAETIILVAPETGGNEGTIDEPLD